MDARNTRHEWRTREEEAQSKQPVSDLWEDGPFKTFLLSREEQRTYQRGRSTPTTAPTTQAFTEATDGAIEDVTEGQDNDADVSHTTAPQTDTVTNDKEESTASEEALT